jgi:hypothetical protein
MKNYYLSRRAHQILMSVDGPQQLRLRLGEYYIASQDEKYFSRVS